MKTDFKSIIILVLLIMCLIFGYIWFWIGGKTYRDNIKGLEKEKTELVKERKQLNKDIDSLKIVNQELIKKDEKLTLDIKKRDVEIRKHKEESSRLIKELNELKQKIKDTQSKIEEIQKNPIKRTGDDLLNMSTLENYVYFYYKKEFLS